MYLTYDDYKAFGGTLDQTAFENLEFKARKRVDYLTDCRVRDHMETISEAVKRCMFSLIETESKVGIEAQASHPQATSFSTDGYSESYGGAITVENAGRSLNEIVQSMLYGEVDDEGTELLYLGVRG